MQINFVFSFIIYILDEAKIFKTKKRCYLIKNKQQQEKHFNKKYFY